MLMSSRCLLDRRLAQSRSIVRSLRRACKLRHCAVGVLGGTFGRLPLGRVALQTDQGLGVRDGEPSRCRGSITDWTRQEMKLSEL